MSRLPNALEPLFPLAKRTHRAATRVAGTVGRRSASRRPRADSPPRAGVERSADTAALEPDAVVLHPVSAPETVHRAVPRGTPDGHPFWPPLARTDFPGRFVLDIRDGRVVGPYSAHLTPSGRLDYETSDYFGIEDWREHPVFLRRRLPAETRLQGSLVSLATRGTAANYYHFLMDLLPRWGIFREAFPDDTPEHVLLSASQPYQRELLEMLRAGDDGLAAAGAIEQRNHLVLRADRLRVPSLPNHDTLAPPWTTEWLRRRFPPRSDTGPRRIYVTRGDRRHTRVVRNETELLPELRHLGFTVVDPGRLSVQEQIDTFASAEVVVAPHGAALTNLCFAQPGVRVLELFAPRYLNSCYWCITSNVPDSTYRYLVGRSRLPVPAGRAMLGVQDDIVVAPDEFGRSVRSLLEG